jgi:PAS domain S-box-containing protein
LTPNNVVPAGPEVSYTYGLLAFLLVCIVAWLIRERSRAVRAERLLLTARRYATGDLEARPGVRGPDELGVLADAVEQMAGQLRTLGTTLRDRQEWFRMLLEHGSDVILTLDREWRIGFAGPSLARALGWTPDQVAGRRLSEFIHPDDEAGVLATLALSPPRGGLGEPIAFRFRHADGGWRSLEAAGNRTHEWSGPEQFILSARDITPREQLDTRLRQAQTMEALGWFAAGVAHDFDHLLTAIQGYASLLLLDLGPADPRREGLEEIRKASERAADLTRQLLAFSRGHAGRSDAADLNTVVADLERILPSLIGDDVALATALDPALRPVPADPRQLEQAIVNLALNARDAMPHGGRLTIATANELVTADDPRMGPELPPGWYAVLTVADTGTGIPTEIRARIFDPFFTTREPGERRGLGLSAVYGIVKQAGGYIEVESAPDRGSTFRVYLPAPAGATPRPGTAPAAERGAPRGETVLLVEDEEAVRVFASKALEQQGYAVLEARHGRDALLRLSEHPGPIRLLITDIVMPEMGGGELARRVTQARPDLRVLFLSGHADGESAVRGLGAGAAHLRKPFTSEMLARKVREMLG